MSWLPANLGAERKKVIWLGGLLLTAVVAYFISSSSDSPPASASIPRAAADKSIPAIPLTPAAPASRNDPAVMTPQRTARGAPRSATAGGDFRPSLKLPEGTDVSGIDPTLHLGLLAKLRNLPMEGGARSVFKEGAPPPPPAPDPVTIKPGPMVAKAGGPGNAEPPKPTGPPPTPPPPPIPLKFYGYANQARGGPKRAFFLEGDDIFVAAENETVHNRYKIIKIGVNSAIVEDTTDKHQQTLPLVEELAG
jgi:hypothetical protein